MGRRIGRRFDGEATSCTARSWTAWYAQPFFFFDIALNVVGPRHKRLTEAEAITAQVMRKLEVLITDTLHSLCARDLTVHTELQRA